ncbi:Nadph dehydrogenase [Mycena sanguinolenta]|uniref:Nadph dehydrogenase n=1 Tax=Mycena sanguinolenta TaxID=230812 RepID=A0A8H6XPZ5_9AGAR|nr:Nadph dehydrogenase [Mycena sanguinolenta]
MVNDEDLISSSVVFPNGRVLRNRLVKVALYEHLARLFGGPPNRFHLELYSTWSTHGWGMIFTGNVQVSPQHLSLARDLVLPRELSEKNLRPFRELAVAMHGDREEKPLAIMQLNHTGRQSPNLLGGRLPFSPPLGPSSIPLGSSLKHTGIISDLLHQLMFQIPRSMSLTDIDDVVAAFVRGAKLAAQTGYDGVELHAAHGYLLAQFISPKSNKRTDDYSCSPKNTLRLLHRIVTETRAVVPRNFILGLKMNSADYADSYENGDISPALDHIRTIASWGSVDFIEISGGDYESPGKSQLATLQTMAFFPSLRAMLLAPSRRSLMRRLSSSRAGSPLPAQLHAALSSQHTHLVGLGRAAILRPDLPVLLTKEQPNSQVPFAAAPNLTLGETWGWTFKYLPRIKLIGAGATMAWYILAMRRLTVRSAQLPTPNYSVGAVGGVWGMWAWFCPEVPALGILCIIFVFIVMAWAMACSK